MTTQNRKRPARKTAPSPASPNTANDQELDDWGGRVYHATLPSGKDVDFKLPSLAELITFGELPTDLQEFATAEWASPGIGAELAAAPFVELRVAAAQNGGEPTDEELAAADEQSKAIGRLIYRLNLHLVAFGLVKPKATAERLALMPYRDVEMLSYFMNRSVGVDAAGRHVGVVPLDTFQIVAHAHGVECDGAPACASCLEAGRELAQIQ